jgi:hypothetical protein
MERRLAAILTALCLLLVPSLARSAAPPPSQQWLVVSDIHFAPYGDARLTERLASAPPERWRAIFASAGVMPYSNYGSDTNYALLESALDGMKSQVGDPRVVIVTGDFLAHGFRAPFDAAVKDHSDEAYQAFVDKTIAFLAQEFRAAFPRAQIVPVVGNNDGYCGDYQSTPRSFFLLHMAQAFAPAVSAADPASFVGQFIAGGYYTVALPAAGARAVVVNDVFWSARYANTCGDRSSDPGGDELNWLRATLEKSSGPTWILSHVPPGVDVYSTLQATTTADAPVTMLLNPRFNDPYVELLAAPESQVVIGLAGHLHMNSFRVVGAPGRGAMPMLVVPSVSPIYSNNPGFSILDVDPANAAVLDDHVFVLEDLAVLAKDGHRAAHWKREYDFDGAFGAHGVTGATLDRVQQAMFGDDRLRRRFSAYYDGESGRASIGDAAWRPYWCGNVAMTATDYRACAMPQVQTSLPPHPSPPPTPVPTPTPSASPSPVPSPT